MFILDDPFTIAVQLPPTTDFMKSYHLTVDFEVWFMNRYTPPKNECFRLETRRTVQILLQPGSLQTVSRSLVFDYLANSAVILTMYSSLISVLPRRRKPPPDPVISTKLRTYHLSVCTALLKSADSIEIFFKRFASLTKIVVAEGNSKMEDTMAELIDRLEKSEKPWATLEAECVQLSARLSQMFTHLVQLFTSNEQVFNYMYEEYHDWRLRLLGEVFFFQERTPSQLLAPEYSRYLDLQNVLSNSKYLKRLPKCPIFCVDTDSPMENCPIIFEERFVSKASATSPNATSPEIENKLLTPILKRKPWMDKEALLRRDSGSSRSLRLLKSRRKSVDSPRTLITRSTTFHNSPGNRSTMIVTSENGLIIGNRNGNRTLSPELPRRISAGETPNSSPEKSSSPRNYEVNSPSTSASSSPLVEPNKDTLRIKALVEFVKEREEVKRKLRGKNYEGWLYSEQSSPSFRPPPSLKSLSSCYARDAEHLVVFVHGLEGSSDDLTPYRNILRVLAPNSRLGFLMSRTNQCETWADINCMARNLLHEIKEHLNVEGLNIKRISFIAHSLGGVIVRAAIGIQDENSTWLHPLLHTFFTINTPHLGLMYLGKSANIGVHLVQWWKRSQSIYQLSLKDAVSFRDSFLYNLSTNHAFGRFKNILLLGTPNDIFVPSHSALLESCKASTKDTSAMGTAYR
ncbi:hypothetical protein WR25_00499 isoform A [Diploscapter pachys]|uniref:DUF676 domain-containing protein n=1 Tax=Diploscapter pachys TaxID=2018661 RepID=A0A2A2KXT0_9BILA|nr:hypothetical protein WR25_00499 isoform A [Diploscapter pachys]